MVSKRTVGSANANANPKHGVGNTASSSPRSLPQAQKAKASIEEDERMKRVEWEFKVKHLGLLGVLAWLL